MEADIQVVFNSEVLYTKTVTVNNDQAALLKIYLQENLVKGLNYDVALNLLLSFMEVES